MGADKDCVAETEGVAFEEMLSSSSRPAAAAAASNNFFSSSDIPVLSSTWCRSGARRCGGGRLANPMAGDGRDEGVCVNKVKVH